MQAILERPEVYLPPTCTCCRTRPLLHRNGVSLCAHCDRWPEILEEREDELG